MTIAWIILAISTLIAIRTSRSIHFKRTKYELYAWAVLESMSRIGAIEGAYVMGPFGACGWVRGDRIHEHVGDTIKGLRFILIWKTIKMLRKQKMVACEPSVSPGYTDYRVTKSGSRERHRLSRIVPQGREKLKKYGLLKD